MINRPGNISNNSTVLKMIQAVLFCALLSGCKNDMKEINDLTQSSVLKLDKAYDVTVLYSERGRVKARMWGKEFVRNESAAKPYADINKSLRLEFFNDSMGLESTVTAKYARYYEKEGNVLIRDHVVVVNKKGEMLKTEELVWNQDLQRFYTDKPVEILTGTQKMFGEGLEANQDFTWYQIKKLHGIMRVEKDQVPQ